MTPATNYGHECTEDEQYVIWAAEDKPNMLPSDWEAHLLRVLRERFVSKTAAAADMARSLRGIEQRLDDLTNPALESNQR